MDEEGCGNAQETASGTNEVHLHNDDCTSDVGIVATGSIAASSKIVFGLHHQLDAFWEYEYQQRQRDASSVHFVKTVPFSDENRRDWKEVRIFVSSTFSDFFCEREVLVNSVIPRLNDWCSHLKIRVVEVDLRWGVPKEATTETIIRACLGEIDRCREQNVIPFFLNMLGQRYGWVPGPTDVPVDIKEEYLWVPNTSITHMEIFHAALRTLNHNALFMFRSNSFLEDLPTRLVGEFVQMDETGKAALQRLKDEIETRFPEEQVIKYNAKFRGVNNTVGTEKVILDGLDHGFADKILSFFQRAILAQYPMDAETMAKNWTLGDKINDAHEDVVHRCLHANTIVGRDELICAVVDNLFCAAAVASTGNQGASEVVAGRVEAVACDVEGINADVHADKEKMKTEADGTDDHSKEQLLTQEPASASISRKNKNVTPPELEAVIGTGKEVTVVNAEHRNAETRNTETTTKDGKVDGLEGQDIPFPTKNMVMDMRDPATTGRENNGNNSAQQYILMDMNNAKLDPFANSGLSGISAGNVRSILQQANMNVVLPIFLHGHEGSGRTSVLALLTSVLRDATFMYNNSPIRHHEAAIERTNLEEGNNKGGHAQQLSSSLADKSMATDANASAIATKTKVMHTNTTVIFHSTVLVDNIFGYGGYNQSQSHSSRLCPMTGTSFERSREISTLGTLHERSKKQLAYLQLRLCLELGNDWIVSSLQAHVLNDSGNRHDHSSIGIENAEDCGAVTSDTEESLVLLHCCEEHQSTIAKIYRDMMTQLLFQPSYCNSSNNNVPSVVIVIDDFDNLLGGLEINTYVFPRTLPSFLRVVGTLSTFSVETGKLLERFYVEEPEAIAAVAGAQSTERETQEEGITDKNISASAGSSHDATSAGATVALLPALGERFKEKMVINYLRKYNKILEPSQLRSLLRNPGCESLTWLSFACESIRVFGAVDTLTDYIVGLPTDINGILLAFLDKTMIVTSMYTVAFSRKSSTAQSSSSASSSSASSSSSSSAAYPAHAALEDAGIIYTLDEILRTMMRYVLISRFSSLDETELRALCGRHKYYTDTTPPIPAAPPPFTNNNSNNRSGHNINNAAYPFVDPHLSNELECSNADWATACFYLRPFFAFKSSKGSKHSHSTVTVKSTAIDAMLHQYFNLSTGYYGETARDPAEIGHRRNLASYCFDTRGENEYSNTRYWSEYAYQLLKSRDLPRMGAFRLSEDLHQCSRYIRAKLLDTCRCDLRLTGNLSVAAPAPATATYLQSITNVSPQAQLREYMCQHCSLRPCYSIRGMLLKRDACCICQQRIFTQLHTISNPGFRLKMFGLEKQASLCLRHNCGVNRNHTIVNGVLQSYKCYYCRVPVQPKMLVPLIVCQECGIGVDRCIFMNY